MSRIRASAWFFVPLLTGIFTVHVVRGTSWWLGLAISGVAIGLTQEIARPRESLRRLATWAGFFALVIHSGSSVVQIFLGADRALGLASHPNLAAAASASLAVSVLVASHGAQKMECVGRRWFTTAVALFALISIVSSGSRSVVIGCALALVLVALVNRLRPRKWAWAALAALAMLAALMFPAYLGRNGEGGQLFRGFERMPIYSVALDMASLSPLIGLGDGAWSRWLPIVEPSLPLTDASHPHSVLLLILIEGGALGFVAVLTAAWFPSVYLIRRAPKVASYRSAVIAVFLSGIAAQALVDVTLLHPIVYGPLVMAGLAIPARAGRERAGNDNLRGS